MAKDKPISLCEKMLSHKVTEGHLSASTHLRPLDWGAMSQDPDQSQKILEALHPVFDQQIMNFGAYHLLLASGQAHYPTAALAAQQEEGQAHFLLGYRQQPLELVIVPLSLSPLTPAGSPSSVDNTNAIGLIATGQESFELELTNGSRFSLEVRSRQELTLEGLTGLLDQTQELEAFQDWVAQNWASI